MPKRILKALALTAGILLSTFGVVRSELPPIPNGFGWRQGVPSDLLDDEAVRVDLGLTADAMSRLKRVNESIETEVLKTWGGGRYTSLSELSPDARRDLHEVVRRAWGRPELRIFYKLDQLQQMLHGELEAILTPEQRSRLDQIHLQKAGLAALSDKAVANELQLSDTQRRTIEGIQREHSAKSLGPGGLSRYRRNEPIRDEALINALTPNQKAKFDGLKGKPLDETPTRVVRRVPGDFGWRKSIPLQRIFAGDVVEDLGLSEAAVHKLRQLHEQIHLEVEAERAKAINDIPKPSEPAWWVRCYEWNDAHLHAVRSRHAEELNSLLTAEQQERLYQIDLQAQREPAEALCDPGVADKLELTDAQRSAIRERFWEVVKAEIDEVTLGRDYSGPSAGILDDRLGETVMKILSDEQRRRLAELQGPPMRLESTLITFDDLLKQAIMVNPGAVVRRHFSSDIFRAENAMQLGTCDVVGKPVVGNAIRLANPVASFEVMGGTSQPFISPHSFLTAAGGGTRDVLMTFERAVTSVSIVSDRYPETPDVIRLLIVEPIAAKPADIVPSRHMNRPVEVRVLAIDEKLDNAQEAPGNTLTVDLKGKPFHHVVIECTTELDGFDDLRFTRLKSSSETKLDRALPLFDWGWLARVNGREGESGIAAGWGNSSTSTTRDYLLQLPKETHWLRLTDSGMSDSEMAHVGQMRRLKILELGGTSVTDQGLRELSGLSELSRLDLRGSRANDHLASLDLKEMQEAGARPRITDHGLKELIVLKSLRWLDLTDTQVTDAGMSNLKGLANLEELSLANTAVTTAGIRELLDLERLRVIDLWGTKVDDDGIHELLMIKSLRHIVAGNAVTREGIDRAHQARADIAVSQIGPEYRLFDGLILSGRLPGEAGSCLMVGDSSADRGNVESSLRLARLNITSDSICDFVPDVRNLTMIDATNTNLGDGAMPAIGMQTSLRELRLAGTYVTDQCLSQIRDLEDLRVLHLGAARPEDCADKSRGGGIIPARVQQKQALGERPRITDAGLQDLRSLRNLEALNLNVSQITDAGIAHLGDLRKLKSLDISFTSVTNAAIPKLAPLEVLEYLDLVGTQVDGEGLMLLAQFKNLKGVRVNRSISPDDIAKAKQALPDCEFTFPRILNTGR